MRGSGTESKNEVCMAFWAKDEVRHPGASEGRTVIDRMIRTDVQ